MMVLRNKLRAGRHVLAGTISLALVACGLDGESGGDTSGGVDPAAEVTSEFSGSVGDGPIVGATLRFYDKDGRLIHTKTSDNRASYSTRIRAKRSAYPITVEASGGTDLVTNRAPDFKLTSVLMTPKKKRVNINPFSTIIVESARNMPGGLSSDNISTASQRVKEKMNFGLDTGLVPDPIGFSVTDDNIANIVKSSEALGEMIRRTTSQLKTKDALIDGDQVVMLLSADLSDGIIDGRVNGIEHDDISRKTSLVSKLVSAQVLIESLSNRMKVDGGVARGRMDDAIVATHSEITPDKLTDSVPVNQEMLDQLADAIDEVQLVDSGSSIDQIEAELGEINPGDMPADVEVVLPADSSDEIVNSVNVATDASDAQLDEFEQADNVAPVDTPPDPVVTPPALAISGSPAASVNEDSAYVFTPNVTGGAGGQVSFAISNRPVWASFDTVSGRLSGTPLNANVGTYNNIVITASENGSNVSLPAFSINVINTNDAPTITGNGAATMSSGQFYSFQPAAADEDGDSLSFSVSNKPSWASFNNQNGRLSGTPGSSNVGTYANVVIRVSDGSSTTSLAAFTITVNPVAPTNSTPSISGSPATSVAEGSNYVFQPSASDADGDALSFSIVNRPSWASFNSSTGRLSGVPGTSASGNYSNIVISVSDGSLSASLAPFSINVTDTNRAPTISGTPSQSVNEDSGYSFQPTAADADGDSLSFSIANRPSWASFNGNTGRLSGTPANAHVGSYNNIIISVSDGKDSTSLPGFSISVQNVNDAPVISGSPSGSVQESNAYVFQPSASDADGDALTYSISNRPNWMSFNSSTGRLSGTPGSSNVGSYSNIVISVSDGTSSVSLPAFSITVSALPSPTNGSISITWSAPVARSDGQALAVNEIASYTIYYGTSSGNYTSSVAVADPSSTSATISDMPLGNYYVVMTTTDNGGSESVQSSEIVKTAQ